MQKKRVLYAVVAMFMAAGFVAPTVHAQVEVQKPQPTEPGIYTLKGEFVRIAYNNEGWVTLGYRTANSSQGQEWMLLEVGVTVHHSVQNQILKRDSFTVTLPDGSIVPLASIEEYQKAGSLRALNSRGNTVRDPIGYFPVGSKSLGCALFFFSDPAREVGKLAYDEFEISWQRACAGRLFFKMPEGKTIEPGQYWLNVQFADSVVQTPFRIMTKEEEKFLRKNWKDIKKEHEAYLKEQAEKAKQRE